MTAINNTTFDTTCVTAISSKKTFLDAESLEIDRNEPLLPKFRVEDHLVTEQPTSCNTPLKQDVPSRHLSWYQRTFGPMQPGSIRASIFSLLSTSLGTSFLTLPYMLKVTGLAVGLGLLFLGATLCWITLSMLSYTSFHAGESEYRKIVDKVLGKRAGVALSLILAFYGFGTIVGYQITIAEFIPRIVSSLTGTDYIPSELQRFIQIMVLAAIIYPVALLRNLYGLRYGTYFGVACIFYILIIVVIQTPAYITANHSLSKITYFKFDMNFFSSFAVAVFAYTCHSNFLPVRAELASPNERRLQKVVARDVKLCLGLYVGMAICGYLSLTENTPQLITLRPKLPSVRFEWVMTVASAAMSITLIVSTVLNFAPTRREIFSLMGKPLHSGTKLHLFLTAILTFSTAFVAYAVPNVMAAMGLIGGIGSVSFAITFPFLLFAKIKEQEINNGVSSAPKYFVTIIRLFAGLFSILGLIGAVASFAH